MPRKKSSARKKTNSSRPKTLFAGKIISGKSKSFDNAKGKMKSRSTRGCNGNCG